MDNMNAQTKVPFYMTYPMQNLYLMEMEYEKDMERMKEFYPQRVRQLAPFIEDYCDGLEYEGSRIYDENPDVRMMWEACEKLFEWIQKESKISELPSALRSASVQDDKGLRCSIFPLNPPEGWQLPPEREIHLSEHESSSPVQDNRSGAEQLHDLVSLLFANEVYRRRCRYRRCRRWW